MTNTVEIRRTMEAPIRVVARVRPPASDEEQCSNIQVATACSQIVVGPEYFYDFDSVFPCSASQKEVYDTCLADIIRNYTKGVHTNVVSYGQRSSGKTHTMTGSDILRAVKDEDFGLLPRAIDNVYQIMNLQPGRSYIINISYIYILENSVYDLLTTKPPPIPLKTVQTASGAYHIPGAFARECQNLSSALECLKAGLLQKKTLSYQGIDASTGHTQFIMGLQQQWLDANGNTKNIYSRLCFTDLNGWDCTEGLEAGRPDKNRDLIALSSVIYSLANKSTCVPYSNTLLTTMLKDAFGGNSVSMMVCCLSPSFRDDQETIRTLRIGSLSRYIVNRLILTQLVQNTRLSIQPSGSHPLDENDESMLEDVRVLNGNTPTFITNGSEREAPPFLALPPPNLIAPPTNLMRMPSHIPTQNGSSTHICIPQPIRVPPMNGGHFVPPVPPMEPYELVDRKRMDQIFKIQFAASQLEQLVSSAEALLGEILLGNSISPTERARIESWMCMKAEAQDCIGSDYTNLQQNQQDPVRHLEVIEELSEPNDASTTTDDSVETESEISSGSSLGEEFYDQLQTIKNKFLVLTEEIIEKTNNIKDTTEELSAVVQKRKTQEIPTDEVEMKSIEKEPELDLAEADKENRANNCDSRVGLLPMDSISPLPSKISQKKMKKSLKKLSSCDSSVMDDEIFDSSDNELLKRVSSKLISVSKGSSRYVDNIRSKSTQIKQTIKSHFRKKIRPFQHPADLDTTSTIEIRNAQDRLQELVATIKVKEALISELKKSETEARVAREKCQKHTELITKEINEMEILHRRAQEKLMRENIDEKRLEHRREVDDYRKEINRLQKKLKSLEKVHAISQNSNANLSELEANLHDLRVQQEELQTQLRQGMQRKQQLQFNIIREDRSARNPLCSSKLSDEGSTKDNNFRMSIGSIGLLTIPSKKRKYLNSTGDFEEKNLFDRKSREATEEETKEHITALQDAVEILVVKRQKLNKKLRKSRTKGCDDERTVLELDEAVEGVDFVKERLSMVLCGSVSEFQDSSSILTKCELTKILKIIPLEELYHLLVRCFNRIVDLRFEFRKQEVAYAELEDQHEDQIVFISDLKSAYQQASLEMEKRLASLQRVYHSKISTMLRQFNLDPSGKRFYEARFFEMEKQLYYHQRLSKQLKDKLKEVLQKNKSPEDAGPSGIKINPALESPPPNNLLGIMETEFAKKDRRIDPMLSGVRRPRDIRDDTADR